MGRAERFIATVIDPLRSCGLVAAALQPDIVNVGKATDHREADSALLANKRAAKTKVDVLVQEMLLVSLGGFACECDLSLDAEEASRFKAEFGSPGTGTGKIVLDPIDGTLEYIQQRDSYSICVGLRLANKMVAAFVFFPARDRLYYCDEDCAYLVDGFARDGLKNRQLLTRHGKVQNVVYINRRVPHQLIQKLRAMGLGVIDDEQQDIGAPDAILKAISGESICYLSYTRQVRDILLGAIIGKMRYGYAIDWQGHPIKWPPSSRLRRGIFGCWEIPKEIMDTIGEFAMI